MISLEVLDTYKTENLSIDVTCTNNDLSSKNFIQVNQNIRNYYHHKPYNFIKILEYIYTIYSISQNSLLDQITVEILKKYKKSRKSKEVKQYIKKFTYIYFVKYEYYYTYKSLKYLYKINIDEIAITNLYIIKKLQSKNGIFFLIKYLYL